MSEQTPNKETLDQTVVHDNVEHQNSILEETMKEFDPQNNSGEEATIENEINLDTFKARIAEAYNAQKRAEQEADKSKKFALQKFAKELLDIVDNLERAMENANANDPVAEGVQLTHKALVAVLTKNGVETVDPQGEKFNADFHEAVGIDPEAEADTVGTVLQKGYSLNGRLLRPAMVRVGQ